jgi:hypothetical protein
VPDPEPDDVDPYYEPFPLTQEEVDELYNAGYIEGTYEELMLPDGRSVKDVVDAMSQQVASSAKSSENTITARAARQPLAAAEYIALMNKRAWDLAQDFPAGDPKRPPRLHENGETFGQSRYVYIFEYYGLMEDENGNALDWKNSASYYGFGACDTLENGVGRQREFKSNSCEDGMYGMDCVGFLMESAHSAGIPIPKAPLGATDERLGNPSYWNKWLEGTSVSAESVSTAGDPQPGDILIFTQEPYRHVAIAATLGNETIVLHSNGKTTDPYTCADYKDVADGPNWGGTTKGWTDVSGPQWTLYSACIGTFGKETSRVRLIDSGTTPTPAPNPGPADVWDGTIDTSWFDPTKTEFTITKASQLAGLAAIVNGDSAHSAWQDNFYGRTVYLGANIDLDGKEWTPSSFSGTFNGGGHTISNLTVEMMSAWSPIPYYYGLFALNSGTIRNINLTGVNVNVGSSGDVYAGGIAGGNVDDGILANCNVSGSVTVLNGTNAHAGGIVGINDSYYGILANCDMSGSVSSSSGNIAIAGGIAGENIGRLSDCDASGSVTSISRSLPQAGGIVGNNGGRLTDCDASGSVTATGTGIAFAPTTNGDAYAGGIVGFEYAYNNYTYLNKLMDCDASGSVTATIISSQYSHAYAGGVIGYLEGVSAITNITNNTFTANTGQVWGIGWDRRKNPPGPSNDGCTLK